MKMKYTITLILFFIAILGFGQNLETDNLWRTKGVYDSLGNFVERAKIQSFLYVSKPNQIQRLRSQDKINMETGETKVVVYRDTIDLELLEKSTFKVNDEEKLTLHSNDSLTIQYNGFNISYVRLSLPKKKLKVDKIEKALFDRKMLEVVESKNEYNFIYQKSGLVKVLPINSESEWESDYKLIDFNGYSIIQGIVSAPKLLIGLKRNEIQFIKIDYRYENKYGTLKEIR